MRTVATRGGEPASLFVRHDETFTSVMTRLWSGAASGASHLGRPRRPTASTRAIVERCLLDL